MYIASYLCDVCHASFAKPKSYEKLEDVKLGRCHCGRILVPTVFNDAFEIICQGYTGGKSRAAKSRAKQYLKTQLGVTKFTWER
jgi:hypothetical protein